MEFTLFYRGPLKSNGKPKDKHEIRKKFHSQLHCLWQSTHLENYQRSLLNPPDARKSIKREVKGFEFVPLIVREHGSVAEINLDILWPQPKGAIITSGGDIDNRLKTLLDALKVPTEPTALPKDTTPNIDETPFYCLLEDDSLITKLSVQTDQLLERSLENSEVVVIMRVNAYHLNNRWGNYL